MRLQESIRTWKRSPLRFVFFTFSLFLIGATAATVMVGMHVTDNVKTKILREFQLEVYLQPSLTSLDRDSILHTLKRRVPPGTNFRFISPGEARERFIQEFGSELLDLLGENPLPPSYLITLPKDASQPARMRDLQRFANQLSGVDDAVYEGELAALVDRTSVTATRYLVIAGGVIIVIALVVAFVILRSAITSSQEIARTFSLLGGSPRRFRAPYRRLAFAHGFLAGCFALGWWWLAIQMVGWFGWNLPLEIPDFALALPPATALLAWLLGLFAGHGVAKWQYRLN